MITLEDCKEFAELNGFELSSFAEKIIARTNINDGYCVCKSEEYRKQHPEIDFECPCSTCIEDVKRDGHCCCHLYLRKEEN